MIIVVRNRLLHTDIPHIHPLLEALFAGMSKLFSKILYTVWSIGLMQRLPCIRRPIWNDVFWLNTVGKTRKKAFLTRKASRIFTSGEQQPIRQVLDLICNEALLLLFDLVDEMLWGCMRKGAPMSHKLEQQSKWWFLHSLHRQFDSFPSCTITKWKQILPIQFIIPIAPSPNFICALSWILNSGPCRHYSLILYLSVGRYIFNCCRGQSWSNGLLYLLHQSCMENFVQWKEWLESKLTLMHPLQHVGMPLRCCRAHNALPSNYPRFFHTVLCSACKRSAVSSIIHEQQAKANYRALKSKRDKARRRIVANQSPWC